MIKLEIEDYCEKCPFFDSDIKRIYAMDENHTTIITCIHKERCEKFYKKMAEIESYTPKNSSCE